MPDWESVFDGWDEDDEYEDEPEYSDDEGDEDDAPDCPKCGSGMVRRTARAGRNAGNDFWGCSEYPECTGTREISSADAGDDEYEDEPEYPGDGDDKDDAPDCPKCGSEMVRRTARTGRNAGNDFWGCSEYPECTGTREISSATGKNADTPDCPDCGSGMVRRTARRGPNEGNDFWGCSEYPECTGTREISFADVGGEYDADENQGVLEYLDDTEDDLPF